MVGIETKTASVAADLQKAGERKERQKAESASQGEKNVKTAPQAKAAADKVELPPALAATPSTIGDSEQATAVVRALMEGLKNAPDETASPHGKETSSERLLSLLDD